MTDLKNDILVFMAERQTERATAGQTAALQIICGIDLMALKSADPSQRTLALGRIDRLIERERLKGLAGHWSYDLNRHIALKQAADRLRGIVDNTPASGPPKQNGARRRRRQNLLRTQCDWRLAGLPLASETHLLGKLRPGRGVVRRHHRIRWVQRPLFAILIRRKVVVSHQMPLQRLELLSVFEADNIVVMYRAFRIDSRLLLVDNRLVRRCATRPSAA